MQIAKTFPNKGMNRESKATSKISLVKKSLISIKVTSPLFVTWDPKFYRTSELKSILDSLLILSHKGTRDVIGFIGNGHISGL